MAHPINLYSSSSCSDCRKLKSQLDLLGVLYQERNVEEDPSALAFLLEKTGGKKITPVLEISGRILIDPSPLALSMELGIEAKKKGRSPEGTAP